MTLFEDNAEILRRFEADGRDLGPSRLVDFQHLFPDKASAEAFASDAALIGFSTNVKQRDLHEDWSDAADFAWDVTASKEMSPTCENITEVEAMLGAIAESLGGRADGWGFFNI